MPLAAGLDRPVRGLALVGARALGAGGPQQVGADILGGQVIAVWQAGLLEPHGPVGRGQFLTAEEDLDVLVGGGDRDPVPRSHICGNRAGGRLIPAQATTRAAEEPSGRRRTSSRSGTRSFRSATWLTMPITRPRSRRSSTTPITWSRVAASRDPNPSSMNRVSRSTPPASARTTSARPRASAREV